MPAILTVYANWPTKEIGRDFTPNHLFATCFSLYNGHYHHGLIESKFSFVIPKESNRSFRYPTTRRNERYKQKSKIKLEPVMSIKALRGLASK